MIELTFPKVLILTRQLHQKSVLFITTGIFLDKGFRFQPTASNGCHDMFMILINLNDIATWNIDGVDYRCINNRISKSEAINLFKKTADLSKKVNHYKISFFFIMYFMIKKLKNVNFIVIKSHLL